MYQRLGLTSYCRLKFSLFIEHIASRYQISEITFVDSRAHQCFKSCELITVSSSHVVHCTLRCSLSCWCSCVLHVLIAHHTLGKLSLRLLEASSCASVDPVYLYLNGKRLTNCYQLVQTINAPGVLKRVKRNEQLRITVNSVFRFDTK